MFHKELHKTAGVFAVTRYYLYIDIDKTLIALKAEKCLSSHPGNSNKN